MVSVGDLVRPYHRPSYVFEVVETNVDRDVEADASRVWRMPSGDTLIENTERDEMMVVAESWLNEEPEYRL